MIEKDLVRASSVGSPLAGCLVAVAMCGVCFGQQSSVWKSGPALRQALDARLSVTWSERQLRDGLTSLSQSTQVAIFLDRRIDPSQTLELSVADEPLQTLLVKIGDRTQAAVTTIGPCVYLGPSESAAVLSTVAAIRRNDVSKLPADARLRLLRTQAWQWSEFAEPRQLLADLARQANVTVQNPELIPHDLWPAQSLPPLAWVDRLSLLVAGFGLTFQIDAQGTTVRLIPLPESAQFEKTYTTRGNAADLAVQLRRIVPQAQIRAEPGKLHVAASQDDHDKVERLLAGERVTTTKKVKPGAGGGEKRYTLTVDQQPAGAVLKTVANSLGVELKYDEVLLEKLKTNVSFTARDVTLQELLKKTLDPLGLTYRVDDKALEIATP